MVKGLYRTKDRLLGDCVRVHWSAGDAAPILKPEIYEALGGWPTLSALPMREDYEQAVSDFTPDPLELI